MLPFEGKLINPCKQDEKIFEAFRTNDLQYIETNLESDVLNRYDGNTTLVHLAAAMEHFHGHNPQEIIDCLARKTHALKRSFNELFNTANLNNSTFYYMCTGEKLEASGMLPLLLTPLELAARYRSIHTLVALSRYVKIDDLIKKYEIPYCTNFDLFIHVIEHEKRRKQRSQLLLCIKTFGLAALNKLAEKYNPWEPLMVQNDQGKTFESPIEMHVQLRPDEHEALFEQCTKTAQSVFSDPKESEGRPHILPLFIKIFGMKAIRSLNAPIESLQMRQKCVETLETHHSYSYDYSFYASAIELFDKYHPDKSHEIDDLRTNKLHEIDDLPQKGWMSYIKDLIVQPSLETNILPNCSASGSNDLEISDDGTSDDGTSGDGTLEV
jgi:hypothetical protein